jgi:hypothetical protein
MISLGLVNPICQANRASTKAIVAEIPAIFIKRTQSIAITSFGRRCGSHYELQGRDT